MLYLFYDAFAWRRLLKEMSNNIPRTHRNIPNYTFYTVYVSLTTEVVNDYAKSKISDLL